MKNSKQTARAAIVAAIIALSSLAPAAAFADQPVDHDCWVAYVTAFGGNSWKTLYAAFYYSFAG